MMSAAPSGMTSMPVPPPALPTPGSSLSFDTHPLFSSVLDTLNKIENTGLPTPLHKTTLLHLLPERFNSAGHGNDSNGDGQVLEDFMSRYVEVLQIQKMELERIFKLCDDFCSRYLAILKSPNDTDLVAKAGNGLNYSSSSVGGGSATSSPVNTPGGSFSGGATPGGGVPGVSPSGPVPGIKRKSPDSPSILANAHEYMNARKKRRGNLPKAATNLLKKWLFEHLFHPYPTEEEKQGLSQTTGLTLNQISNWFINARRRILQPMLETVRQQQALQGFDQGAGGPPPGAPLPPGASPAGSSGNGAGGSANGMGSSPMGSNSSSGGVMPSSEQIGAMAAAAISAAKKKAGKGGGNDDGMEKDDVKSESK